MIPGEDIDRLRQQADISTVIGSYIPIKKTGKNFLALCPFHSDKNPSFSISTDINRYRCFSCGESGDSITFVMKMDNLEFPEAVHKVGKLCGIAVRDIKSGVKKKDDSAVNCLDAALKYFTQQLQQADERSPIRAFIRKRGMDSEIEKTFELGYAPDSWNSLNDYLRKLGFPSEDIMKTGLVKVSESGKEYDFYRDRLTFAIRDHNGELIGFASRALDNETKPKYLNPPETALYNKSKVLYGTHTAKIAARKNRRVLLTEGYMDVIAMYTAGYRDSVAVCGTALTSDHVKLIKSVLRPEHIILILDGDQAGIDAMIKSSRLLLSVEAPAKVCVLEDGLDPDEFLNKNGKDAMDKAIEAAMDSVDFLISVLKKKFSSAHLDQKSQMIRSEIDFIRTLTPIMQDLYTSRFTSALGLEKKLLIRQMNMNTGTSRFAMPPAETQGREIRPVHSQTAREDIHPFDFILMDLLLHGIITMDEFKFIFHPEIPMSSTVGEFLSQLTHLDNDVKLNFDVIKVCTPDHANLAETVYLKSHGYDGVNPAVARKRFFTMYKKRLYEIFRYRTETNFKSMQEPDKVYRDFSEIIKKIESVLTDRPLQADERK